MNIGTWNLQSISGKMEEITEEIKKLDMDIVVLTETKKKGIGIEKVNNYVHIFSGVSKHERAKRGVSVLIHKKHKHKITDFEAIDENIIRVNITIKETPITILGIYAISDDEPYTNKDEFFAKVNDEITKIGNRRELIVMGDLNSRVGRKVDNKVVGPYGEINQNDNGERLIEICENHQLKITNGFFKHRDVHKYTWTQTTRNLKSIIDYIITKQNTNMQVQDTRAYRGITCGSDHYVVKSKVTCPFRYKITHNQTNCQPQPEETLEKRSYNLDSLTQESTRILYQQRLDGKLMNITETSTVEEVYGNVVVSVKKAAEEALGFNTQRKSEKLWWNKEIEALVEEKKQAYIRWLSSKQQKDRDEYLELKRITRRTTVKAKREMWDKKCQEINTYLGGRKCTETVAVTLLTK
ncbi:craniofacial development protein 2-like [Diabrotica virgifera virgifera]|uniref:Endonuclease/exonuclease/phosphatase domain-containing protein n=1 Tax=Diabrotica virgifera virgifera TaxID=50390 RepID=A0ABM5K7S4_DIAVI|nr:craniofacial development protein 2-like [Diabrotica virgifera virgifera]XP_050506240.1 craniofacial development protein 2-like [Diabrotica virgifera virgifera]XP_050506241.1 craniofacial development protein 2-like [Diabrotica virgifera virgifera]